MKIRFQDVLAAAFVLAGIAILAFSYHRSQRPAPTRAQVRGAPVHVEIDLERLLSPEAFTFTGEVPRVDDAAIVAIFLLHAKVCPPCLNEVSEYTALLVEQDRPSRGVRSFALVLEEDRDQAQRFAMAANLPLPAAYGYPEDLVQRLARFGEDRAFQQLVFIDRATGVLFYRTLLPNTITPLEYKDSVLREMSGFWEALQP